MVFNIFEPQTVPTAPFDKHITYSHVFHPSEPQDGLFQSKCYWFQLHYEQAIAALGIEDIYGLRI